MTDFQLVKAREYPESVRQVAWNGDDKQPLLSVIVDGGKEIHVLSIDGEQKHVLSGHAEPVISHDWVLPDTVASVSADGELRVWTIRGSRIDCLRVKDKWPAPHKIVVVPAARRIDVRFALWYQDASLAVFEVGKPTGISKEAGSHILGICAVPGVILVLRDGGERARLDSYDTGLVARRSWDVAIGGMPAHIAGFVVEGENYGFVLSILEGKVVSFTTRDAKPHVFEKAEEISCFAVEPESRTLLLGMKSGMVHTVAFRPDTTFVDTISSFEVHEFKITAVALIRKALLIAVGGLDGVFKLGHIPERCLQKSKVQEKSGMDWKERERLEGKVRQAEDAVGKGEATRASELLDAIGHPAFPEFEARINQLSTRLRAVLDGQRQTQATRQRLIDFLERVAEERGEILLGEISKALSLPMADIKRWIKALDAEMEWEYIEQHECLILFDRSLSIARMTDIERQISREGPSFVPRGQRRQLGRVRPGGRPYDRPPQQRQGSRPHDLQQPSRGAPAPHLDGEDVLELKRVATRVTGKMEASILGTGMRVIKTVGLADLIPAMEALTQPARAVITDGIISPRLVLLAEKVGMKVVVGQRIHPNLDRAACKVACLESQELDSIKQTPLASGGAGPSSRAASPATGSIEGRLFAAVSTSKWQSAEEIMANAGIIDEFERSLAPIKLKQLAASGTLASEVVNKVPFFLKVKE